MAYSLPSLPAWCEKQRQSSFDAADRCRAFLSGIGPRVADTWSSSSAAISRHTPSYVLNPMRPCPTAAMATVAGVNALIYVAHCAIPALAIPSIGAHVGVSLAAGVFGWTAVHHRFTALASVAGAALGTVIVLSCALTSPALSVFVIGLTAGGAGLVGYFMQLYVDATQGPSVETRVSICTSPPELASVESVGYYNERSIGQSVPAMEPAEVSPPASVAESGLNTPVSPMLARIRAKLEHLDSPLANLYRAKGLQQLEVASGVLSSENRLGALAWVKRFETLLQTLEPMKPTTVDHIRDFDERLEEAFSKIWGNEQVKNKIRGIVAVQQRDVQSMGIVCITGESGSGKNLISNAVKKAYGASREIFLPRASLEDLTGFVKTYVDAAPSLVTSLLMENPGTICVLHIDEVDLASAERQRALLSLLASENQFVDDYFGLPINKNRLFVVCSMKGTEDGMSNMLPDLWNRIKKNTVRTSQLTTAGKHAIAEQALEISMRDARMPAISDFERTRVASEICRHCPETEPGRWIIDSIAAVIECAALREKRSSCPPKVSPDLVLLSLQQTWTARRQFKVDTKSWLNGNVKKTVDALILYAIVGKNPRDLRWIYDLEDGRTVTVDIPAGQKIQIDVTGQGGELEPRVDRFDLTLIRKFSLNTNEILSAADLQGATWPKVTSPSAYTVFPRLYLQDMEEYIYIRLDDERYLVVLPLALFDSDTHIAQLKHRADHYLTGHEDEKLRIEKEIDRVKESVRLSFV